MMKKELNPNHGKRLKECLEHVHMTQKILAEKTGYTQQYISNIVAGKRNMSLESARKFSEILHVEENYLLCKSNYKTPEEHKSMIFNGLDRISRVWMDLLEYNYISIEKTVLKTDNNETIVGKPRLFHCIHNCDEKKLLGKQMINGIEYNIVDIKYRIKIIPQNLEMDVSFDGIRNIIVPVFEFLQYKCEKYIEQQLSCFNKLD